VRLGWKILLGIWLLDSAALAWLFGSILLSGGSPEATDLAGELGKIWGACAGIYGWHLISSKWKARRLKLPPKE
jgi:hypothetical protein